MPAPSSPSEPQVVSLWIQVQNAHLLVAIIWKYAQRVMQLVISSIWRNMKSRIAAKDLGSLAIA